MTEYDRMRADYERMRDAEIERTHGELMKELAAERAETARLREELEGERALSEARRVELKASETELEAARREADLCMAKLLMVGAELCNDPKIDPDDHRDPRWTPTLKEARRLRTEAARLREELDRRQRQLVEAVGAMHDQSMGPSYPGTWEQIAATVAALREELARAQNPEVTNAAPCPICRRATWRCAINDALGLAEPFMGDALDRAVKEIHRVAAELEAARAELARVRELPERWRAGFRLLSDAQTCARDLDAALTTPPAPVSQEGEER